MKTRMTNSSLEALSKLGRETQKEEVLRCIKRIGNVSSKGISFDTGIPINCVVGRVNDLMHSQQVKVVGKTKDVVGAKVDVNLYSIRKESDPLNVFEKSWEEKFNELTQMLKDEHPDILHKYNALYNLEL